MLHHDTNKLKKNVYNCVECNYKTDKKSSWKKHLLTKKHRETQIAQNAPTKWECKCGKVFKFHSGLYRHNKKCNFSDLKRTDGGNKYAYKDGFEDGINTTAEIIGKLQKQGLMSVSINGNNNTINNQKIFNINLFLNENCANAMSIQDFAEKLKITMDDLNKNKKECISNVVLNNIKPMDITERPFHCANLENKEWYIKDQERGWEEDDGKKVIKSTEYGIDKKWSNEFEKTHPNWKKNESQQDKYIQLATNSTTELNNKETGLILDFVGKNTMLNKI